MNEPHPRFVVGRGWVAAKRPPVTRPWFPHRRLLKTGRWRDPEDDAPVDPRWDTQGKFAAPGLGLPHVAPSGRKTPERLDWDDMNDNA